MADQGGNVVAHRFAAQWPVGVWRAPMRLEMDSDHLPVLGQFGHIAPEAVWVNAPVKKNERLAGAVHAVKDMLAIDVGKIRIRHSGILLSSNGKCHSQYCGRGGSLQEIASRVCHRYPFHMPTIAAVTICLRAIHPAARTVRAGLPLNRRGLRRALRLWGRVRAV